MRLFAWLFRERCPRCGCKDHQDRKVHNDRFDKAYEQVAELQLEFGIRALKDPSDQPTRSEMFMLAQARRMLDLEALLAEPDHVAGHDLLMGRPTS